MARLNAKQRRKYATVMSGGEPKYPIPDKAHARVALARINQAKPPLSPAQRRAVERRARAVLGKGTKRGK